MSTDSNVPAQTHSAARSVSAACGRRSQRARAASSHRRSTGGTGRGLAGCPPPHPGLDPERILLLRVVEDVECGLDWELDESGIREAASGSGRRGRMVRGGACALRAPATCCGHRTCRAVRTSLREPYWSRGGGVKDNGSGLLSRRATRPPLGEDESKGGGCNGKPFTVR